MTNILEAIANIYENRQFQLVDIYQGRIRINGMGDALENYIKDAFASSFAADTQQDRITAFNREFSWLGVQNHPPDIIIKSGDAIEVKKTQSERGNLPLNSSYPKADIRSDSPMITQDCRDCEDWTIKDIIYAIGHTSDNTLKSLWFVYGSIYAAKHEVYQKVKTIISKGIQTIPNVEVASTREFSRVNRVDPLGITNLRIRGMWEIKNPKRVYEHLHPRHNLTFELVAIIPTEKYYSFPQPSKDKINSINSEEFLIEDVQVQNPNNPAQLIDAKIIKWLIQ